MTGDVVSRQNAGPLLLGRKDAKQGGEAHVGIESHYPNMTGDVQLNLVGGQNLGPPIHGMQRVNQGGEAHVLYPRLAFRRVLNRIIPNMTGDVELNLLDGQNVGPPIHGTQRVKQAETRTVRIEFNSRTLRNSSLDIIVQPGAPPWALSVLYPRLAFRRAFQSVLNRIIPQMTGDVESNLLNGQNSVKLGGEAHGEKDVEQGGEAHGIEIRCSQMSAHRDDLRKNRDPPILGLKETEKGSKVHVSIPSCYIPGRLEHWDMPLNPECIHVQNQGSKVEEDIDSLGTYNSRSIRGPAMARISESFLFRLMPKWLPFSVTCLPTCGAHASEAPGFQPPPVEGQEAADLPSWFKLAPVKGDSKPGALEMPRIDSQRCLFAILHGGSTPAGAFVAI
ncbi:hypothetical protein DFH08DRAFT_797141 [Mycena albidolilacea]|uniref:Uncharacterized protein n=1 Tax=Mycena albidolilacea TaxID=1033008 RepID=A0AAD7ARH6_9AGAR|nr:hypothetical protein DFH08DRAFT_797141 [Mycena albidolilacea]